MKIEEEFKKVYDKAYEGLDQYAKIPGLIAVLAVVVLAFTTATTGSPVKLGTDFTGGTEVIFSMGSDFEAESVEQVFAQAGRQEASAVRQVTQSGEPRLIVQAPPPALNRSQAENILASQGYDAEIESFRSLSSSVSDQFFQQAGLAFLLAFTIMSTVIFTAFNDFVPALAVVAAAASDIIVAAAGMSLLGIPLSLGTLAALLMLIGYSVDTDIVLSSRVLKRERGTTKENIYSSIKTGSTMSVGGVLVFSILLAVSLILVGQTELSNIAAVMVIGLTADLPITWLGNAVILKKRENKNLMEMIKWR